MPNPTYVISIANFIITLINAVVVPLIFAIAFLVFIWGVYNYFIAGGGNEEKRKEGRNFILYGIIGFFVMISVWGLVNLLVNTFGFNRQTRPPLPSFGQPGLGDFQGGFNGQGSFGGMRSVDGGPPGSCFAGIWCENGNVCYRDLCVNPDTIPPG